MAKKKETRGGAGRGQGRKTRVHHGLEPRVTFTSRVEPSVKATCIEKHGSIAEALRYAVEQATK